ncbi:Ribonuclease H [Abeliophyllum distichum]|uniref:Ribonuclease H n=1 Tax=Abeliophyllum distichum TaxID=126358 RepID=A0ABD1SDA8_9LAMI
MSMWQPYWGAITGAQNLEAWVLLAINEEGLHRICKKMPTNARSLVPPLNLTLGVLTSILSPWPFSKWGIDLIGPMPTGKGRTKYAIVVVDYFTKWAEAEPLAKITEQKTTDFIRKSIICRFGVPYSIVTDNGKQFENSKLRSFVKTSILESTSPLRITPRPTDKSRS